MKTLFKSVAVITIFSIVTRALGLVLKIYISREIGAQALGWYQIALSVFSLLCVIISSGLPLIISKNVSKSPKSRGKTVFAGFLIAMIFSGIICAFVIGFPQFFNLIFGQGESTIVLLFLLPGIIGTAIYASFRGALWGDKEFFVLGFVEFIEQIIRFAICIILFNFAIDKISGENIAGLSLSIACILSSIVAIIIYFSKKGKFEWRFGEVKSLLKESSPITFVRTLSSVVTLLLALIVPLGLEKSGLSQVEAISQFGIATGMVMPLVTIPGTLIGSISTALIPEISDAKNRRATYQINTSLCASIIISTLLIPIFISIGKPLGRLLFENNLSGEMLFFSSLLLVPMGLSQITSSILNATGRERQSMYSYLISSIFLFGSIIFLPRYVGIYSLIIGLGLLALISSSINLFLIRKCINRRFVTTAIISIILCIPSTIFGRLFYNISINFFTEFFSILIACIVAKICLIILYLIFNILEVRRIFVRRKLKRV